MKKILMLLLGILLIAGCSNKAEEKKIENTNETEEIILKEPKVEWCQVYNPNGFNTVTCVLSNPNDVDIDVTYDIVFYKNGKEVYKEEDWGNSNVSPDHNDIIWGNVNIPDPEEVDDVKIENIYVSKSYFKGITSEIKYLETKDNELVFSVKNSEKPTMNGITFLLYNDDNKNKKCDEGELVVTVYDTVIEKESKISFDASGYQYNSYEIYYNAYVG